MASYPLIGKKTVYIDDMIIPPDYVQDEVGTITLTPSTTEIASQSGTIKVPNGSYDEMSFELNIICPSVRFLGMLFPELYHNAKFKRVIGGDLGETGQVRFGGNECISNTPRDIIIHNVCDGHSSAQDFRIPQALISAGGEFKVSLGDPFVVTLSGTMTSSPEGAVVMGELNLDTPSYYDETTGTIKQDTNPITKIITTPSHITGNINDTVKVKLTILPDGATGDITTQVSTEGLAETKDNGDGTWNLTLKKAGIGTLAFKSGNITSNVQLDVKTPQASSDPVQDTDTTIGQE